MKGNPLFMLIEEGQSCGSPESSRVMVGLFKSKAKADKAQAEYAYSQEEAAGHDGGPLSESWWYDYKVMAVWYVGDAPLRNVQY